MKSITGRRQGQVLASFLRQPHSLLSSCRYCHAMEPSAAVLMHAPFCRTRSFRVCYFISTRRLALSSSHVRSRNSPHPHGSAHAPRHRRAARSCLLCACDVRWRPWFLLVPVLHATVVPSLKKRTARTPPAPRARRPGPRASARRAARGVISVSIIPRVLSGASLAARRAARAPGR